MYLPWIATLYSCTSFTLLMCTYHWWFGYALVSMLVQKCTHYSPWYSLGYRHNYYFGKWNTHTKRDFPPLYCHIQWWVDILITRNGFRTLINVVITYLSHSYMVCCVTNANTIEFIHMNVHPWLVINLYLTPNLVLIHF
jgi:hypothetical protein